MPPRFHYISTCTQFARTDSCLLLWGRRSENIEPAHCAERQQRRHNSDSSERKAGKKKKKCFDVQKSSPHFLFFIRRVGQEKRGGARPSPSPPRTAREVRGAAGICMNGVKGNPSCHPPLPDGIFFNPVTTGRLIRRRRFLEVVLIGAPSEVKLLFLTFRAN